MGFSMREFGIYCVLVADCGILRGTDTIGGGDEVRRRDETYGAVNGFRGRRHGIVGSGKEKLRILA
jgi:hypothetical protein